jgi:hypothetical protein
LPISAADTVTLAVEHTRQQLFRPFRLGQWAKLAVVGLLAEFGFPSARFNWSNFNSPTNSDGVHFPFPSFPGIDPAVLVASIVVLVIVAFVVGLILMYVGSVMRFVLFDSILAKECRIRESWSRRHAAGWRYFLFKLIYALFSFGCIFMLIGIPLAFAFALGWLTPPKEHLLPLILGGIVLFFALLIFVVLLSVIFVLTKDFVVPQMALEDISAFEGWRRLWTMLQADKSGYAGYIGMKIALAIGAGIVVGIATVVLALVIALPTVGLGILAILTGKSAGLTWNAYTITLAVVVGSVLLAGFLYVISLFSVPVIVFFPAYSIYFFAARYRPLNAVLYPLPPVSPMIAPTIEPGMPPPPPPTPEPAG